VTVKQLIAQLSALPPGSIVIMSKDGEGNSYTPLADLGEAIYRADSTWSGELVSEEDREKEDKKAVVLWPTG
jgi:hypothetical protein